MKNDQLYIQLFSLHGLLRAENIELGRDLDTGGQIKYVVELAKSLSESERIRKVDLFTRRINDKTVSPDYGQAFERVNEKLRIVRIRCGGSKYIRKELLWPHLDEFVDKTLKLVKDEGDLPDFVHGHYADAGYVASELSTLWGVPFVFTGHSLGREKKNMLKNAGLSEDEMNKKYRIDHRIAMEELAIQTADFVITSTSQEAKKQYAKYEAQAATKFCVIPPGIDTKRFSPFYVASKDDDFENDELRQANYFMQQELARFLTQPEKPLIFALSRPDRRKNIQGLVSAYGKDKGLQAIANLAIFAGIRKDITKMDESEQQVLTELLLLMDKFDLYGKLAIPKRHDVDYEVPELYRLAAEKFGVFVNPAFHENFGLTAIEAAACGLPIVATDDGGPRDIVKNCQNGLLVDTHDESQISEAIKRILLNRELWKSYSKNGIKGVREHYTWQAHCSTYITELQKQQAASPAEPEAQKTSRAIGKRLSKAQKLFVTDIDGTLLGDETSLQVLIEKVERHRDHMAFGVATGRHLSSIQDAFVQHDIKLPDVIIASVGSEIYYGPKMLPDNGWKAHISMHWDREKVESVLSELPFLRLQEAEVQSPFKISYYMDESVDHLSQVHHVLSQNRLRYELIYSDSNFLDILPYRASKGKAIRYLSYKWNIPLQNILVSGDTENDEDMLRGEMRAVVVGNYQASLERLKGLRHIYFAEAEYAAGILEGIAHYNFLPDEK